MWMRSRRSLRAGPRSTPTRRGGIRRRSCGRRSKAIRRRSPSSCAPGQTSSCGRSATSPRCMFAVRGGHVDAARRLLAAGANVNDAAPDGTRVLTMAIVNAHYELAALLLDQGADPNATDPRGSALHALSWMRNPGYAAAPPRTPTGNARQPGARACAPRARRKTESARQLEGSAVRSRSRDGAIAGQHLDRPQLDDLRRRDAVLHRGERRGPGR